MSHAILCGWVLTVTTMAGAVSIAQTRSRAPEPARVEYPYELVPEDAILGYLSRGKFREPSGVFFDRHARELFVADAKNGLIGIFDPEATPLFVVGDGWNLVDPNDLFVSEDGTIHVLDADQFRVHRFDYRGNPLPALEFTYPAGDDFPSGTPRIGAFTMDDQGRYYVGDRNIAQVLIYDRELRLERVLRSKKGSATFRAINGLVVAESGLLAVLDFYGTPVQLFDATGRFLCGFGGRSIAHEDFTAPVAAAFDHEGYLFVVDMLRHDVKIFDLTGRFAGRFGGWFGPETGGRRPGEMLYPSGIAIDPDGLVYVAERFGNRVQMFRRRVRQGNISRPLRRILQEQERAQENDRSR